MPPLASDIRAVLFDYGNTLIEFGQRQLDLERAALLPLLRRFGPVDEPRLADLRRQQVLAPYSRGFRENVLEEVCAELLREVLHVEATPGRVAELAEARRRVFVEIVQAGPAVLPLLSRLARRYRLALVSNYPCGRSIRASLAKLGLAEVFDCVVVSGDPDVGRVKPHPLPYTAALGQLGLAPRQCVHVGDNWLADVQGAKRLGMGAVLSTQYVPYEPFARQPGDHEPDATIDTLGGLEALFPS